MSEEASGSAIASLICGILSFMACPVVLAIAAIMLGSGDPSSLAKAGRVLGWINLALCAAGLLIWVLLFVVMAGVGVATSGG